jgi:hypothetical protein
MAVLIQGQPGSEPSGGCDEYRFDSETIRVDEIKSWRRWNKDSNQEALIDGDVTKLYMKGTDRKETNPEILILESYDSFNNRMKAIKLNDGRA